MFIYVTHIEASRCSLKSLKKMIINLVTVMKLRVA